MHFTLCDLAADIAQNAAESGADLVTVDITEDEDSFRFTITDNGKGMTEEELQRARDPFHSDGIKHPNRKVGLGIPFLAQTAEQSGGWQKIESRKGLGTRVEAFFDLRNIDTPPVGDVAGLFRLILGFAGPSELLLTRQLRQGGIENSYELRKTELIDALGNLEDSGALVLLDRYIRSLEEIDEQGESDGQDDAG